MGIYVFKKDVLVQLLKNKYPGSNDFGGEIIPMAAAEGQKVIAYLFNDYWEDIGTMKSFFDANLALAQTVSHLLKEQKKKKLAFQHQFNEKPSVIPSCPENLVKHHYLVVLSYLPSTSAW